MVHHFARFLGNDPEAEKYYRLAVQLDPERADGWFFLGARSTLRVASCVLHLALRAAGRIACIASRRVASCACRVVLRFAGQHYRNHQKNISKAIPFLRRAGEYHTSPSHA